MKTSTRIVLVASMALTLIAAWSLAPASSPDRAVLLPKHDDHVEPRLHDGPFTYDDALARLNAALERQRNKAAARADDWMSLERLAAGYLERARLTGDWHDYGRAEDALHRAFERAPEGAGPHMTQAALDYALHRFDRVETDLQAVDHYAIAQVEVRRAVRSLRADLMLQKGRYEEAGQAYEALVGEARTRDVLVGLAGHRWKTGHRDEAERLLAEAEEMASGSDLLSRAWLCLARGLLAVDDARYDDAIAHYRRGEALLPGWFLLEEHEAEALTLRGDTDRALAMYRGLIERTNDPEFMDAAAGILEERGETAEAARLRERAHAGHEARIAMFPEAAYGHALGHYLAHHGDEALAVRVAERNRDVRPNGEAWTQLAEAYQRAGRIDEAREAVAHVRATAYRSLAFEETAAQIVAAR